MSVFSTPSSDSKLSNHFPCIVSNNGSIMLTTMYNGRFKFIGYTLSVSRGEGHFDTMYFLNTDSWLAGRGPSSNWADVRNSNASTIS